LSESDISKEMGNVSFFEKDMYNGHNLNSWRAI
jgi:hypothetical protein